MTKIVEVEVDAFEVGDVAVLVSGSPDLTVLDYCGECGKVGVAWFDGARLNFADFPEDALDFAA